jgi:hypothetical protein
MCVQKGIIYTQTPLIRFFKIARRTDIIGNGTKM